MEMLTNCHPLVNETCPRWKSHEWCHEHDTWHHCCNLVIDDQEDYNLSLDWRNQ